jgi:SAM-dependent methyltransferase
MPETALPKGPTSNRAVTTPHTPATDRFMTGTPIHKASLEAFLAQNPFPHPTTLGFFYGEKMRAIHHVAPDRPFKEILEVGGGRSGLTNFLYPQAFVTNIDLNPEYASAPNNQQERIRFVHGDATRLPFEDESFDAITMFDLLEHVPDDNKAIAQALRVLRPGGVILISTPNENWRFPYYGFMKPFCPTEEEKFAEWGHVRRGYSLGDLKRLIPVACTGYATFINPVTVLCHDIAFSHLPERTRRRLCTLLKPVTLLGYTLHKPGSKGTETASVWQKDNKGS